MSVYLIAAFVLLLVMVFLILRPFVAPVADGVAVDAAPAERAKAAATVEAVSRTSSVPTPVPAPVAKPDLTKTPTATAAPSSDVRSSVEAAIAARKAALAGTPLVEAETPVEATTECGSCQSALDPGDVFCRSCGAKQSA